MDIKSSIEGILFVMGNSVSTETLAKAVGADTDEVEAAVQELAEEYEKGNRGIRITRLGDSYQMASAPEIYPCLVKIAKEPKKRVLTDSLLETLSIIAYRQPVTKAEIEKIRGVSSDHAVNKLVEYELVQEVGRMDAPGRPMLFGTTEDFLRTFGVSEIKDSRVRRRTWSRSTAVRPRPRCASSMWSHETLCKISIDTVF